MDDQAQRTAHERNNKLLTLLGLLFVARQMAVGQQELCEILAEADGVARRLGALLLAAGLLFLNRSSAAESLRGLARELSSDARQAGIARVAVLPFEPVAGGAPGEGRAVAEDLTTQFVRLGRVQAVERTLLQKPLEEHGLAGTGLLQPASVKKLGAVLAADGIVTGSFVTLGRRVKVNARLIQVETGLIVSAGEAEVDRQVFADGPSLASTLFIPAPVLDVEPPSEFPVAVPNLYPGDGAELRDAPSDEGAAEPCVDAAARADRMESLILDLKARYWALRLKKGLDGTSLRENPGSSISDPGLKSRFYGRVKFWYGSGSIPELSPTEVRRFVALDRRAFDLHRDCGI